MASMCKQASAVAIALLAGCGADEPAPAARVAGEVELRGYRRASAAELRALGWRTDLERATVPLETILHAGDLRAAFPPITAPRHAPAARIALDAAEPVLVLAGKNGPRAWPLLHLLQSELVLDEHEGVPLAVSFCTLCSSARVFDRRLDGELLELATSGLLLGGGSLLYDRRSESLWRQLDGVAVAGEHAGARLSALPATLASFGELARAHPGALVMLAPEEQPARALARLSAEAFEGEGPPYWLRVPGSDPLAPLLALPSGAKLELSGARARNLAAADGGPALVALLDPAAAPAQRARDGGVGAAIGCLALFAREHDGRLLTLEDQRGALRDRETGSLWNVLGEAVAGPLTGARLEAVPQVQASRFAFESAR